MMIRKALLAALLVAPTSFVFAQVNSQGVTGGPGVVDFMGRKGHIRIQSGDLPPVPANVPARF